MNHQARRRLTIVAYPMAWWGVRKESDEVLWEFVLSANTQEDSRF
jgi:hypothetical protein